MNYKIFCMSILVFLSALNHPAAYPSNSFIRTSNSEMLLIVPTTEDVETKKIASELTPSVLVTLTTSSGIHFPAEFFDRGSDKVIILGQGFPGPRTAMLTLVKTFHDYDVLIFDYRWLSKKSFFLQFSSLKNPIKSFIVDEREEVVSVVNFLKTEKEYKEIVGLGLCYSAFIFVLAQAKAEEEGETLFTRLILDSCWHSLIDFFEVTSSDPSICCNHQKSRTPICLKKVLKVLRWPIYSCIKKYGPSITIEDYLKNITSIPLLFIHGFNDFLVPYETTFERMWKSAATPNKTAFITPFGHVSNTKNRAMYKQVCDDFIADQLKPNPSLDDED